MRPDFCILHKLLCDISVVSEGEKNLPPQNMPPGQKDYFKLISFKKQHT